MKRGYHLNWQRPSPRSRLSRRLLRYRKGTVHRLDTARTCAVLSWLLPEEETAALLTRAGEEQTSIHGAFCAAFLLAHNDLYGYQPHRTVSSPVSLRGRFGIPNEDDFGLYMALSEVTVACSERGDLWVMARAITAASTNGQPTRCFCCRSRLSVVWSRQCPTRRRWR